MNNTLSDEQLPALPQSLIDLIGEYGMARTDGVGELERLARWSAVIVGIKDYARALLAANTQAAPIYQIRNMPNAPDAFKNAWFDASEDAYHTFTENNRRIVHASPAPASAQQDNLWHWLTKGRF